MAFLAFKGFLRSSNEILSKPLDFNSFSELTNFPLSPTFRLKNHLPYSDQKFD